MTATAPVPATDRETSEQRLARYLSDFRQRYEQARREQWTGDFSLTLNLNGGHPTRREICFKETAR